MPDFQAIKKVVLRVVNQKLIARRIFYLMNNRNASKIGNLVRLFSISVFFVKLINLRMLKVVFFLLNTVN
jgi:hypothetical protein